jgi:hypothetical protein
MRIITAQAITKRRAIFLVSVFFGPNIGLLIIQRYRTCLLDSDPRYGSGY